MLSACWGRRNLTWQPSMRTKPLWRASILAIIMSGTRSANNCKSFVMPTYSNSSATANTDFVNSAHLFAFHFTIGCVVGTRPRPILRPRNKLCLHGIIFNIRNKPRKALISPQPVIECFILPERLSCAIQDFVCCPGRKSFQSVHELAHFHLRREQHMNMIRHYDIGEKLVLIQLRFPSSKSFHDAGGNGGILQPEWAFHHSVHG